MKESSEMSTALVAVPEAELRCFYEVFGQLLHVFSRWILVLCSERVSALIPWTPTVSF